MENVTFTHKVSKGSKFNQIYIPKERERYFEVGDLVEIKLLEKKVKLYYSNNLNKQGKLSEFKEDLIRKIFSFLSKYKEIEQIFVFGSFLTKKLDYNDIDIMLLVEKESEKFDKEIYLSLSDKFNLKFHLISIKKDNLKESLKISPLTRSMLYYYISNKEYEIPEKTEIDINHIRYLLMFPEDLLKFNLDSSEIYYNNLRKLLTIESFLNGKDIDPKKLDTLLLEFIDEELLNDIKKNAPIEKDELKTIKNFIRQKLKLIMSLLKNGKK